MEHRLILGGSQYLPLARSEVRRLLALGLPYASKKLLLPDATIVVWIQPGHEYIRITGGGALALPLDSGVVDMGAFLEANPATWLAGTLYETDYVTAYNVPFALQAPDFDPPRLYPNPGVLAGQFSGILRKTGIQLTTYRGEVPVDEEPAQSFRPRQIEDGSDPPVLIDDPADANLAAKKAVAGYCPASMFTGRARLYAQSLYGAHAYANSSNSELVATIPFALNDVGSGDRPALVLNNRIASADSVTMTSGSCVYLDPATGKHYLFTFEGGVRCYVLKSSQAGERLRPYLITDEPVEGLEVLSEEDRAHLEAYILSQSLPSGTGTTDDEGREFASGSVQARFGMGFSWHWNWDGTTGDIVEHSTFDQGGGNTAMRATWRRATIAKTSTPGYFTVSETVVEGPTDWAVYRSVWTITYPDWSTGEQIKLTPKTSSVFACDAPLYAFYVGNDLKTCRVTVELTTAPANYREQSDYFTNSSSYGGVFDDKWTYKLQGGFVEDHAPTAASYYEATFTCGSVTLDTLEFGRTEANYREEITEKTAGSYSSGTGSGGFGTRNVPVGDSLTHPLSANSWNTVSVTGTLTAQNQQMVVTYNLYTGNYNVTYTSRATLVVPFYDAEAVYFEGTRTKSTSWTRRNQVCTTPFGGGEFMVREIHNVSGVDTNYERFGWEQGGPSSRITTSVTSDTTTTVAADTTLASTSKLIGHAGVVDATFSNLSSFHDNNAESVATPMPTISGTRVDDEAVVIAAGHITEVGTPFAPAVAALVGWV